MRIVYAVSVLWGDVTDLRQLVFDDRGVLNQTVNGPVLLCGTFSSLEGALATLDNV